jgi:hypothetical protein
MLLNELLKHRVISRVSQSIKGQIEGQPKGGMAGF